MRQQRVFTEEEKLLIVSWYVNGKSSNTIAKEFRTAPSKVMEIIKEAGLDLHESGRPKKNDSCISTHPGKKVVPTKPKESKEEMLKDLFAMQQDLFNMQSRVQQMIKKLI